jgi:CMP/dCMP kinase
VRPTGAAGLRIAIDGPGSSGKTSVGMAVASALGLGFVDTGLMYRAITWLAMHRAIALDDGPAVAALAGDVHLASDAEGRLSRVRTGGRDVTRSVRAAGVDRHVSEAARQPEVRAALVAVQRALAAEGGIVMVGRDIGTVVLPDADLKVYLDASAAERARRRGAERGLDPSDPEVGAIRSDLERRDAVDSGRAIAPLRAAEDAVVIVTDGMSFDEVVARVVALAYERLATGAAR